jgi:hypothetical protein
MVPMMCQGRAIGTINVTRPNPGPFSYEERELLKTFADQAVIAIENTRLFEAEQASKRKLAEALEQQTATADVLKVISRSALDVQKVLDALVESAARLCNAYDASIFQVFGDGLRLVAHHGRIPTIGPVGQLTFPLVHGLLVGRAVDSTQMRPPCISTICLAIARRWVRARPSRWSFPRAPTFESAPFEQARPSSRIRKTCGADTGSVRSAWWVMLMK